MPGLVLLTNFDFEGNGEPFQNGGSEQRSGVVRLRFLKDFLTPVLGTDYGEKGKSRELR